MSSYLGLTVISFFLFLLSFRFYLAPHRRLRTFETDRHQQRSTRASVLSVIGSLCLYGSMMSSLTGNGLKSVDTTF